MDMDMGPRPVVAHSLKTRLVGLHGGRPLRELEAGQLGALCEARVDAQLLRVRLDRLVKRLQRGRWATLAQPRSSMIVPL